MTHAAHHLVRLVRDILLALHVRPEEAELVADNLVEANLVGHDSHGVDRVPRYVNDIRSGHINVRANVRIVGDGPGFMRIDGDWTFGQVAATRACGLLVDKARGQGVAAAGLFNTNDVGRLGAYTSRMAEHGFLALMTVNDGGWAPLIAPWGGKTPLFSTNPISVAAPGSNGPAFCVDMATSIAAGSRIDLARKRGESVPPGLIMDAEGEPSIDPSVLFGSPAGSILPLGAPSAGHKGLGLNLIIDVLSGALTGAGCSGTGSRDSQGVFLLLIDVKAFTDMDAFIERTSGLLDAVRSTPRRDGFDRIRIPGEAAEQTRQKRLREGVVIADVTWRKIRQLAHELKVEA